MTHHTHGKDEVSDEVVAAGAVSNVMEYLKGLDFPAKRDDVLKKAKENGADVSAIEEIKMLPADRRFEDPGDLIAAIGGEVKGI